MRKILLLMVAAAVALAAGCAGHAAKTKADVVTPGKQVKTLYIWDADGHTDLTLLRALKAGAKKELNTRGFIVTDDPNANEAFVKITVLDAFRDADKGKSYIKARMYFVDAMDNGVFYDKTAEARVSGHGETVDYPVGALVTVLLSDYPAAGAK